MNINIETAINKKVRDLKPSGIRRFFDIASEMKEVISLGIGEPDFVTPWHICDAGIYALERGETHYTSNSGLTELRREISAYLSRRFDLSYSYSDEILITIGGSEAVDLTVRALVDTGDEVLIPDPAFVCYEPIVALAGGTPVRIKTRVEDEFRITPEALKAAITPKTKMLILSYPNNPTGGIMEKEHLEALAEILRGTDIIILSDEIYAELTYGGLTHFSIARLPGMYERTIVISGFSKSYAMTGWRLGYVCGPKCLVREMTKIHQFTIMSAPTQAQFAAIQAMQNGDGDIDNMREEYDRRRRFITEGLNRIGLSCFEPKGAFYVFPCIKSSGLSSDEFCERLLREEHVAIIPGTAFGESGEGFARCSYASSIKNITEALRRIEGFLAKF